MTRRKDLQPEAGLPQEDTPPLAEPLAAEPFVVSDPVDPPATPPADAPVLPPEPPVSEPREVVIRRGSFAAPMLGGALAALGGFALSHFDVFNLRPDDASAEVAALTTRLAEIEARTGELDQVGSGLATLTGRVSELEAAPTPEPDLSRLDALDERLAAIEAMPTDGAASTAAVSAKLAELERRLAEVPAETSPEVQQQLEAALARLDEAEATATARAEEASAASAVALRATKLDALADRLTAGEPFAAELQALEDPALGEVLAPLAESGVPTLVSLQQSFPDAAREALRVARDTNADDGWGDRFLDFLAGQTGARPLTPLDGTTPDAILSRAEFALSEGRVADAVAELDPLDPAIKAPLDPWLASARSHLAATAALAAARGE